MPADSMNCQVGCDLGHSIVKVDPSGEKLRQYACNVFIFERMPQEGVAHATTGAVGHLRLLYVIARLREKVVVAAVVEMHMGQNDVLNAFGIDPDHRQPLT